MGPRRQPSRQDRSRKPSSSASEASSDEDVKTEDVKPVRPPTSQYEQYQATSSAQSRAYYNLPPAGSSHGQQQYPYRSWQYQYPVGASAPPPINSQYTSPSHHASQSSNRNTQPPRSAPPYSSGYYPNSYPYSMPAVSAPAPVGYMPWSSMTSGPYSQPSGAAGPSGSTSDHSEENEHTEASVASDRPDVHRCRICGRGFTRNANRKAHMKVHDPDRLKYCCPSAGCQKTYGRYIDAIRHYQSV